MRLASRFKMASNAAVNVFTYGTLMFDPVWNTVAGRLNPSRAARLENHEAWKLAGQTFPGMAPAPGHRVNGRLWQEVTPEQLTRLDAFESGIYDRLEVLVAADGDGQIKAWTYIVRSNCRTLLLDEPWDPDEFRRLHLTTFLSSEAD